MAFFRREKLAALTFQKTAAHQLLNHTGTGGRCPKARAFHALNLRKFLRAGVFHCREQQIFREVFGRAGGSLAHRRFAAGKGLPFGDGWQSSRFRIIFFRFLFQSGEEGLFHGFPAVGCHHAALCKKGSAAAIQYYRCVLIDLLFADRAQKPNHHQSEDVALPGGQCGKCILLYLHGRQQRMVVADL